MEYSKLKKILTFSSFILLIALIYFAPAFLNDYAIRILNLSAIYVILAANLNLTNDFTGLFSLGHAGFMSIGAYTTALLLMSEKTKIMNFYMYDIWPPLQGITLHLVPSLLIGGTFAAIFAVVIGAPTLKLRGDYLAIATLGFGEIIKVIFKNSHSITNGALGLKGIPGVTNFWWNWGIAALVIFIVKNILDSSYGFAFKAIRDDEIAAKSIGVNIFNYKLLSFVISAFLPVLEADYLRFFFQLLIR